MVRASLLSLPVVVALVGSPAQAAAPPRPPVLSPNALEVARKQLREVGLSLPDAASCPACSGRTHHSV